MRQFAAKFGTGWRAGILLFLVALVCRSYRASQMPVAMPDAIRHIEQAQAFANDPLRAVREEVYHPLHSLAILGAERVWNAVHPIGPDVASQRLAWVHAAQAVGTFFGALMAPLLFLLARRLGARPWAAACAAGTWIVSRRTSAYGIDGMSDMLALCLFTVSMLLALRCMPWRRTALSGRQATGVFAAGLFAGLSYLTRPEGLAAPLIVSVAWLVAGAGAQLRIGRRASHQWKSFPRQAPPWKAVAAVLAILWAGVALPAAPYAAAIGGITNKKQLVATEAQAAEARENTAVVRNPIVWVWLEIGKTFGYVPMAILLVTIAIAPAGWGRARFRVLMLVWTAIWIAVMFWLLLAHGYLNGRHTLILQVLLVALFALALQQIETRIFPAIMRGFGILQKHASPHHLPAAPLILFGILVLASLPGLSQPAWPEMLVQAEAATWARARLDESCVVADRQVIVGYYSMHPYVRWWGNTEKEAQAIMKKAGTPVVFGRFKERVDDAGTTPEGYQVEAKFSQNGSSYAFFRPLEK